MLVVTTIYCAESEPAKGSDTGKVVVRSIGDLKGADRKLLKVYQGTNREHPIDS